MKVGKIYKKTSTLEINMLKLIKNCIINTGKLPFNTN
jgi:hypothetical protein